MASLQFDLLNAMRMLLGDSAGACNYVALNYQDTEAQET